MQVQVDHGVGNFRALLKLLDDLAIVTHVGVLGKIFFHAQPAVQT